MKKIVITVSAIIIMLLIVAFWFSQKNQKRYSGPIEKITIADASQAVFALIYIAEAKGYLDDEGLDITYKSFTSGRDALTSVVKGESDLATVFDTPIVLRTLEAQKLSIITELSNSAKNYTIIARRDRGISMNSDLSGKTIAVTKNSGGEFFLYLFLTTEKIALADVTVVDTKPQDMVRALKEGAVDAIATWEPHIFNAKKECTQEKIITFYSNQYIATSVLAGKESFVKSRPEAMKRLLRGLVRAEALLQEKDEIFTILFDRLPEQPEDSIRNMWSNFSPELRLSNILLTVLTEEARWFIENSFSKGPLPNFRKVFLADYLKEIKPEAVTVLEYYED